MKFADTIYELERVVWNTLQKEGINKPFPKDRVFLQWIGTDYRRKVLTDDVWAKIARNRANKIIEHVSDIALQPIIIIDDLRFMVEFNAFPDACKVRLDCPREIRKSRCSAWGDENHPSEIELDLLAQEGKFDLYLDTSKLTVQEELEIVLKALYS